jgi:transmembrane sensor
VSTSTEAAEWFARSCAGSDGPGQDRAFREWLAADPANASAYRDMQLRSAELAVHANDARVLRWRAEALREVSASRRRWPAIAAMAAVVAMGCLLGIGALLRDEVAQGYSTGAGERTTVALDDGTSVTLAPRTHIDVSYDGRHRRVTLRAGQALFDVARDARRPFEVQTSDRVITAIGTVFQVSVDDRSTKVMLVEGAVIVATRAGHAPLPSQRLVPGQRLEATHGRNEIHRADVDTELAWGDGKLEFRDQPLSAVVESFNRFSADSVVIGDPAIGSIRVSGSFRYEGAQGFLAAVEHSLGLAVRRVGSATYRIERRSDGEDPRSHP